MNRGAVGTPEALIPRPRVGFAGVSLGLFVLLAIGSWVSILFGGKSGVANLFSRDVWAGATKFIERMVGTDSESVPAYLSPDSWLEAAGLAYETVAMSVLAMGFAGVLALLTFMPAARNVAFGELAPSMSILWRGLFFVVRGVYIFTRGIPELLWAMLILFFFSPGVLPGALALGLHNLGIVGKLSAEVVENLDSRPARALRSAGAGPFQMLAYGILPQTLPSFLTYLLYRWEVIIRTTIVVGLVGAGGLGREFRLSMSWFHYTDVTLLLMVYLVMVLAVDLLSAWMRKLAR